LGTLLIVTGIVLGIVLGCGIALGVIPLFDDYKKPVPRAARKGIASEATSGRSASGVPGSSEDARPSN
jgi:hypothetical protein